MNRTFYVLFGDVPQTWKPPEVPIMDTIRRRQERGLLLLRIKRVLMEERQREADTMKRATKRKD